MRPLLLLLLFSAASGVLYAQSTSGIDCECSLAGPYANPRSGLPISVKPDSTSPGGKYKLYPSGPSPYSLVVRRVSDNVIVYSTTVSGGSWGFSPDGDRFVHYYLDGGSILTITLVDLTATGNKEIWTFSRLVSDVRITFSPHGRYFLTSILTSPTSVELIIVGATTGITQHTRTFTFSPGGDTTGVHGAAGWGYSPDSEDRTFSYLYVTGQGVLQWRVINLASKEEVEDQTIQMISGFWKFSPCGDLVGLLTNPTMSSMRLFLYRTATHDAAVADQLVTQVATVLFRADTSFHIANVGGTDMVLAPNGARSTCVIAPDSLTLTPRTITGGESSAGRVTLNAPAPSGGLAVLLASSNEAAATVPASVLVPQGLREKTFTVSSSPVSVPTKVVISASANSVTRRDTLTLLPLDLVSFTLSTSTVKGGDAVRARYTLSGAAPSPGISVALSSSKPSLAAVPPTGVIATGKTADSILITTTAVTAPDSAVIRAIAVGDTLIQTLHVFPPITLSLLPDTVVGGNAVTFVVSSFDPAPPGGLVVPVSSSDSGTFVAPTLTIPQGQTITWANDVPTRGVDSVHQIVISSVSGSGSTTATLRVSPARLLSFGALTDSGCTVTEAGGFRKKFLSGCAILFRAALDGEAPPSGGTVLPSSTRADQLPVPPSITLGPFGKSGDFSVRSLAGIASPQVVILSATYRGVTQRDTVVLIPAPRYDLVDISQPGSSGYNYQAINNPGDVLIDGVTLFRSGSYISLNSLPGFELMGVAGMNDDGWLCGASWDTVQQIPRTAYWKPNTTVVLPSIDLSHPQGSAVAINNDGMLIGLCYATTYPYQSVPVAWLGSYAAALEEYPPYTLTPVAINDSATIVGSGYYYNPSPYTNRRIAVRWVMGRVTPIIHPQGEDFFISAADIAADGTALLVSEPYFFLHRGGFSLAFGPPPPYNRMTARALNDSLVVVGDLEHYVEDVGRWYSAFVKIDDLVYDLKCLADFPSGWTQVGAMDVNNEGIIVGHADEGGEVRLFVLMPTGTTAVRNNIVQKRVPDHFELFQNYPNPFNPSTVIRYALPSAAEVTLEVINLLGQRVQTLVRQAQQAGEYEVKLEGRALASGIYFYRLQAGSFAETRKMVILK